MVLRPKRAARCIRARGTIRRALSELLLGPPELTLSFHAIGNLQLNLGVNKEIKEATALNMAFVDTRPFLRVPRLSWKLRHTALGAALAGAFLLQHNVGAVLVDGPSMEPTLVSGQYLLIAKGGFAGRISEGDVVVIEPEPGGTQMIKRVHRLAGGTVDHWRSPNDHFERESGPYIVPDGTVYVLGDNPFCSYDSREFGALPLDRVVGKAIGVKSEDRKAGG